MFLKIRGPQNPFQIPISAMEIHDSGNPNVKKDSYIGTTLEGEGLLISVAFGHGGPGHRLAKVYLILEYFGPGQPSSAASPMPPSLTLSRCLLLDQAVPGCKMLKISKSAMLSKAHGKALAFVIAAVIFSGILRFLLPGWSKLQMSRTTKQEYYFGMRRWSYGKLMKALFSMMTRHADSLGDMVCSCFFVRSTWNNVFLDWRSESSLASSKFIGSNSRGWSVDGSV